MNEHDWRLFKEKLPAWQEAYMERLNAEYVGMLCGKGKASAKFRALDERIRKDRKSPGVVMDMRRATMLQNMMSLLEQGVITMADLEGFSEELIGIMKGFVDTYGQQEE